MKIQEHVPLAPLTTLDVGGAARFFAEVQTIEDVEEALRFAHTKMLPLFVLGGGSNILIADRGFDGLVLRMRIGGLTTHEEGSQTLVTVGAGMGWDDLVVWSIERGLAGLTCMSGVPGTVGGAVVANVGCYGAQCSDTLFFADVIDTRESTGTLQRMQKEECNFSYHDSIFGREPGRYVVVRATFALARHTASTLFYRDNRFDMATLRQKLGHEPTQWEIRESVLDMREEKGHLIMQGRSSYKSAGSFFHMPFVSKKQYEQIVARARELDTEKEERLRPWAWEQSDGSFKLAPGFLLEYTEFQKGYTRDAVGVSPRHTLAIINRASAHASDIAMLALDMQNAVEHIFGVRLEREVEYIGNV